jgi:hypothetical protein
LGIRGQAPAVRDLATAWKPLNRARCTWQITLPDDHGVECLSGEPMSIRAIYENGIFKPLEEVPLKEGTEVEV